ncbi:hypothetical protein BMW23_0041 [Bodo saltans virus]|uniref:Uncharacterized protein n=1 Tax=Bodo saltans virus TaxID=2024608 RepID=A0A2H4UT21_9VIRU|nr:hypothetical protein QJ851_gp0040 [Bodo saltans virus]ATZ80103.1 hypothetical protein BMW23_0041 [Bodo saltans virus]
MHMKTVVLDNFFMKKKIHKNMRYSVLNHMMANNVFR